MTHPSDRPVVRQPAEQRYAEELAALAFADQGPRPAGWRLSPRAVRMFICGSDGDKLSYEWEGTKKKAPISRKFYGDDILVERSVIGLCGNRGVLLIGEPGTAKSMLSELLAAAISGTSLNVIQGTAATTEDQIRYSWNYALLLAEGPSRKALVPSAVHVAMNAGILVRFEEITRCPPEVQDTLVSILSEKVMMVPELEGDDRVVFARPGFNVIATANTRDRGVHEMSSALKRRFNFETVPAIRDLEGEIALVSEESERLLADAGSPVTIERNVVELLVTTFQDLRQGVTAEGIQVEKPTTVMSTAEAVSVAMSAGLDALYYGKGKVSPAELGRHIAGAVLKDSPDDLQKLKHYFDVVVQKRAKGKKGLWEEYYKARKCLP